MQAIWNDVVIAESDETVVLKVIITFHLIQSKMSIFKRLN